MKLICLDEPTAALGVKQTAQVVRLIRSVAAGGTGVILVTHDLATVRALADRIVVLVSDEWSTTAPPTCSVPAPELMGADVERQRSPAT